MKNILKIIKGDFSRIGKNIIAVIVILGICVIPALYAWFNIASNWDPYSSTSGIKVAVVNNDTSTSIEGMKVDVGKEIVSSLKENHAIGWQFVDETEAMDGVKAGRYYAVIVIPAEFSAEMTSFINNKIETPQIKYYVNEKKNAIAPKITDKGISTIQEQVNSTFIDVCIQTVAKVFNNVSAQLEPDGVPVFDRIINTLNNAKVDLDLYGSTIDAFMSSVDAVNSLIKTTKLTIPDLKGAIEQGESGINQANSILDQTTATAADITNAFGSVIDSTQSLYNRISGSVASAISEIGGDANAAAGAMKGSASGIEGIVSDNNQAIAVLQNIQNSLPVKLSGIDDVISKLNAMNSRLSTLSGSINDAADVVSGTASLSENLRESINSQIQDTSDTLSGIRDSYRSNVEPQLNSAINTIQQANAGLVGVLKTTDSSISNLDGIFDGIDNSLTSGQTALSSTKDVISKTKAKIDTLISEVNKVSNDEKVQTFFQLLKSDPEVMGDYMSSPVSVDTESLYPVKNYGSAMAPFYSILAIWVGGIVLVAILKVRIKPEKYFTDLRPWQSYIGRYFVFMVIGIIQSVVICLGDLYFMQIQCESPVLFVIAGAFTGIVFTLFIYTMTVSFGDIGKALCVIIMVLQVAGSGGTFPLEVLPQFFQNLAPFLPFTYAINAMRECVAGIYGNNYIINLLYLAILIPVSLLLGLVLRKPLIKLNEFFESRLEDTKLM